MPSQGLIERIEHLVVGDKTLAFYGLGQVGVTIKGPGGVIYIDPYLTSSDGQGGQLERLLPSPVAPETVTNADVVLISHEHPDHFDPETLRPLALASPEARFYAPYTCGAARAGVASDRWHHARAGEAFEELGARITPIPSAHTELEGAEQGHAFLGYVIEWNGVTVYHAGDTVIWDGLIETLSAWKIDVAFIPINGRDYFRTHRGIAGNTDHREAAELAEVLDIQLTVPTHFDLIAGNTSDPGQFVSYLHTSNPLRRHKFLSMGELYFYVQER